MVWPRRAGPGSCANHDCRQPALNAVSESSRAPQAADRCQDSIPQAGLEICLGCWEQQGQRASNGVDRGRNTGVGRGHARADGGLLPDLALTELESEQASRVGGNRVPYQIVDGARVAELVNCLGLCDGWDECRGCGDIRQMLPIHLDERRGRCHRAGRQAKGCHARPDHFEPRQVPRAGAVGGARGLLISRALSFLGAAGRSAGRGGAKAATDRRRPLDDAGDEGLDHSGGCSAHAGAQFTAGGHGRGEVHPALLARLSAPYVERLRRVADRRR
eukprot:scaffold137023_cov66-Phaeocystis_antarctica.AAC.2